MIQTDALSGPARREFLKLVGSGVIGLALRCGVVVAAASGGKPLEGIFPIAQTPFRDSGELDLDALVREVDFIHRGGVHGFVWPQMASEWSTLTEKERMAGNEAILATGKKRKPAIVIGVQAPGIEKAIQYAKQAERLGADAVISLPPGEQADPNDVFDYYLRLSKAVNLPLIVQAVGNMSVELLVRLNQATPQIAHVKDEAGNPLRRITPLREQSRGKLKVFSGAHGRTLIQELRLGSSGTMPAASFADLYAATWDLWKEGKHLEAIRMHGYTLAILTEMSPYGMEGMKYILVLRGVFRTWKVRQARAAGFESAAAIAAGSQRSLPLDEPGRKALQETLEAVRLHLRA